MGPIRFPANCVLVALVADACGGRLRTMRNRSGRLHAYWVDKHGAAHEFYRRGTSSRSYLRNAIYWGHIRRCPSLDENLHPVSK